MRKLRSALISSLVLLFVVGCTKEEIQPDSLYAASNAMKKAEAEKGSDHFVPFKGVFEVSVVEVTHYPPPPPMEQVVAGCGNATYLGKTAVLIDQDWYPPPPPREFPWPGTGNGTFTFTAANGDELKAEYTGTSIHWSETKVTIEFNCTITGGSGRFTDAVGSFKWTGIFNPTINIGNAVIEEGEIMC